MHANIPVKSSDPTPVPMPFSKNICGIKHTPRHKIAVIGNINALSRRKKRANRFLSFSFAKKYFTFRFCGRSKPLPY